MFLMPVLPRLDCSLFPAHCSLSSNHPVGPHKEEGCGILDLCINQGTSPPFDPMKAVSSFANVLKEYRVCRVTGDRYAGETFKAAFEKEGVSYHLSPVTKHEIYESVEVLFNTGQAVLLDHEITESQFLGLVWRGSRIDHPASEHDDHANAAAGALVNALKNVLSSTSAPMGVGRDEGDADDELEPTGMFTISPWRTF
jgi:hypothetical protein